MEMSDSDPAGDQQPAIGSALALKEKDKWEKSPRGRSYLNWQTMKARCENERNPHYQYYGGRGIAVCDRWQSFDDFLEDMGEWPRGMTLERIDNSRGYEPGNCRWATRKEQQENRRNNIYVGIEGGERITLAEYCRKYGLNQSTIRVRLHRGWTLEEAING
jgi:hypothetical protein